MTARLRSRLKKLQKPAIRKVGYATQGKSWRKRRTAYRSGRLEMIGYTGNPFKRKRKVINQPDSSTSRTPLKGNFRWRRY